MIVAMIGQKGIPSHSGGIERHVEELSACLARLGVTVISYDRPWYVQNSEPVSGVIRRMCHGVRSKHFDAITHSFHALLLARKEHPDVIHFHGVGPSLLAPIARVLYPRTRIISTFHCVDRAHQKWGWFARFMLRAGEWSACTFAHRTIVVSDSLSAYCLKEYQAQTHVIPNGVRSGESGVGSEKQEEILGNFDLKAGTYFCLVARLVPHKNIHIALEAYANLAARHPEISTKHPLVIIGGSAQTDEYVAELQAMAKNIPGVLFTGELQGDALRSIQSHALAHLSISSSEGMSIALLEAMMMAKPLIVSDISENIEVVETDAFMVRANDVMSLSRAMENMIDLTDDERALMGEKLRVRALVRHNWDRIAEETLRVYQEVMKLPLGSEKKTVSQ